MPNIDPFSNRFIRKISARALESYPISIYARDIEAEKIPPKGGTETFNRSEAVDLNTSRMNHLASLGLPLEGKRVLDVGCGVGNLTKFFMNKDCEVVCIDGREENIISLRSRYPSLVAHVANIEREPLAQYGTFDVVFCYGLLYHLENPLAGLRNMTSVCKELLLLETMVCDSTLPILWISDETKSFDQGLGGLGVRPTPSFVVMALNRLGFKFTYAPKRPPEHEDFKFQWKNNLDTWRNGRPLRCIFISSRTELSNPNIFNLLSARAFI